MIDIIASVVIGAALFVLFGLFPHRGCAGHCVGCTGSCGRYAEGEHDDDV